MKNKTALPRLRFPEFRDAPAWEEKEIGEVFKVTRGKVLAMTLVQDIKTKETPYPVYSSQTKNNGLSGFYSKYLYEDAITWTTDGANAGDVNYRPGKFFCTNVCGVLINADGYANLCIASLINKVSRKYVSYVGNPKLMNGVMSKIKIPFPSLPEQQKIADCLSALDELISAQSEKVAALQTYKKGLMQNLFPAEGESVPRLRFEEFKSAGEWEETPINKLFDFTEKPEKATVFDKTKIITVKLHTLGVVKNERTGTLTGGTNYLKRHAGEFIFSKIDLLNGAFGLVPNELDGFYSSSDVPAFRFKDKRNAVFFVYWLKANYLNLKIERTGTSSTLKRVSPKKFLDVLMYLPNIEEQQRIAGLLSALDEEIHAQGEVLAGLRAHKRGLMQQLFPQETSEVLKTSEV